MHNMNYESSHTQMTTKTGHISGQNSTLMAKTKAEKGDVSEGSNGKPSPGQSDIYKRPAANDHCSGHPSTGLGGRTPFFLTVLFGFSSLKVNEQTIIINSHHFIFERLTRGRVLWRSQRASRQPRLHGCGQLHPHEVSVIFFDI